MRHLATALAVIFVAAPIRAQEKPLHGIDLHDLALIRDVHVELSIASRNTILRLSSERQIFDWNFW